MRPRIAGRAYLSAALLTSKEIEHAARSLLFKNFVQDTVVTSEHFVYDEEPDFQQTTVNEYVHKRGVVSVPRSWAMKNWKRFNWHDDTSNGGRVDRAAHVAPTIVPRDEDQKRFFEGLYTEAIKPGPQDILANARTGSGKSVAGIYLGAKLGVPTLFVVDSNKILAGWERNIRDFYGDSFFERFVGRTQQERCEFEGKYFGLAMVHSLVSRNYGTYFKQHWGCVVFDEVQVFGSVGFSPALSAFNARVRVGLTATNREGEFGRLIKAHLGVPKIVSHQDVLEPKAYVVRNSINVPVSVRSDPDLITSLGRLTDRNTKICKIIKSRGYDRGRHVLVLSDRVAHLQKLMKECEELGIPAETMGLHVGQCFTDKYQVYYSKLHGKAQRLTLCDTYAKAYYIADRLHTGKSVNVTLPPALQKHIKNGEVLRFSVKREQKTLTTSELDNITDSCQIIFATYQIFSKGVNVPRLDMGVEGTPIGKVTQPLGRILRIVDGKSVPEWYAILDRVRLPKDMLHSRTINESAVANEFFTKKHKARMAGFKKANAEVKTV